MIPKRLLAAALIVSVAFSGPLAPAFAQATDPPPSAAAPNGERRTERPSSGLLSLLPEPSVTRHSLALGDTVLDYTAEAGTLAILDGKGEVSAEIFHTSYVLEGADRQRPVTFVFNGGPGAASAYLHIGAIGPRVLKTAPDGSFLPPPQTLIDNPDTWLTGTDLVFVDPPGTGYSRAPGSEGDRPFWGVDADARALGAFIRLWLQKEGRTDAPVVLAGESYGGFRATLLARTLQEDVGISPSALIMISPAMEFSILYGEDYSPLTWALQLPAFAAVHFEREGVTDSDAMEARLDEVEAFATGPYMAALASGLETGGLLVAETVARYTGLPLDLVRKHHGRVPTSVFVKRYEEGRVLSRYDGSISAPDRSPSSSRLGPDAVLDRSVPVLTQAFVTYVREELGFKTDISYRLLNGEISGRWDYGTSASRQGHAGVLDDLMEARSLNPSLRVLITHGYADLITTYFASEFLVRQLPTLAGAEPIQLENYPGGHMMYFRAASREALADDALALIAGLGARG